MGTEVIGSYIDIYTYSAGVMNAPQDLRNEVSALIPDGNGGFREIIGTGLADGTFTIPNVPLGLFYARIGSYTVVTSARVLDVGRDIAGSPNELTAQSPSSDLSFNIGNLAAPDDYIMFSSLNDPDVAFADLNYDGTTGSFVDTFQWQNLPLIDGASGDRLDVRDLTRATTNGFTYVHAFNWLQSAAFTMIDGQTTTVAGTFAPLALDQTTTINWDRSRFDALRLDVNPRATNVFPHFLEIATGPPAYPSHAIAYLAMFAFTYDTGTTDEDYGPVTYSDPYPADWPVYNDAESDFDVTYSLPGASGASGPLVMKAVIGSAAGTDASLGQAIVPQVSPPTAPMVNGMSAFSPLTNVGLTPVISWSAPEFGQASGYSVYVCGLALAGMETTYSCVAEFVTNGTSFQVLPGLLAAGTEYFAIITAHYLPSMVYDQHPFRFSLPFGSAGHVHRDVHALTIASGRRIRDSSRRGPRRRDTIPGWPFLRLRLGADPVVS